ncbi:MAG: class I SAM-dependent methyltransferase [Chitinophagaceae bacterium]
MINILIKSIIDKYSKYYFVKKLLPKTRLLDVGCGNHSASKIYYLNKNISIDGIDIIEYNTNEHDKQIMNNYFIVEPDEFNNFINKLPNNYNSIVCSHVIEHVANYEDLLTVLLNKLAPNGLLYLSFPNANSVNYPKRSGTLNFYDDETHEKFPPDVEDVKKIILKNSCEIVDQITPNKILLGYILGMLVEPISILTKKVLPFTWYYWGFENVFIVKKN